MFLYFLQYIGSANNEDDYVDEPVDRLVGNDPTAISLTIYTLNTHKSKQFVTLMSKNYNCSIMHPQVVTIFLQ